jgi:hypothetical protein
MLTVAGMASKGLRSSIYPATRNNIGSTDVRIRRTPLFAIPVVIASTVNLVET